MQRKKPARIELIGQQVEITDSTNKTLIGFFGKIIDETKNTLVIKTTEGKKTAVKDKIYVKINDKIIDGKNLTGRIETRIKQN